MRRTAVILVTLIALANVHASALGQSRMVVASPTHDCGKAPNASIETNSGTFTFTGRCDEVLVKGSNNTVTIEATKRIEVTGPRNTIAVTAVDYARLHSVGNTFMYQRGLTMAAPDVVAIGDNNSIVQGK
jgi:hypothetical protein